jgi:hypothetical protein
MKENELGKDTIKVKHFATNSSLPAVKLNNQNGDYRLSLCRHSRFRSIDVFLSKLYS